MKIHPLYAASAFTNEALKFAGGKDDFSRSDHAIFVVDWVIAFVS
jgi:hypothetical protein